MFDRLERHVSRAACSFAPARTTDATRVPATGSLARRIELESCEDVFRELANTFDCAPGSTHVDPLTSAVL